MNFNIKVILTLFKNKKKDINFQIIKKTLTFKIF